MAEYLGESAQCRHNAVITPPNTQASLTLTLIFPYDFSMTAYLDIGESAQRCHNAFNIQAFPNTHHGPTSTSVSPPSAPNVINKEKHIQVTEH